MCSTPNVWPHRILGMGDIVSLVERAQDIFDEEEARKLQRKIQKNKFDFNDFLAQIQQIKKMGNLKDLASMIPGVGKALKDVEIDDNAFKGIEAIILSMTMKERENPENPEQEPSRTYCTRFGYQHSGGEPTHQTVRPDAQNDETRDGFENEQHDEPNG